MNAYSLPTSINIRGVEYPIHSDFRCILDILIAQSDQEMQAWEKQEVMYRILYPDWETMPGSVYKEACESACKFIDGNMPEGRKKPRTMDWEQDAAIIIPAVNKVAGKEVRATEYLHWWTFLGYFMEIEEGMFSQVLAIRQKKAKGKKLEKWEKEFERENAEIVRLKKKESAEERRIKEAIIRRI